MINNRARKIVCLILLILCVQQVNFAQGLVWKAQVIQRQDKALIYKTKEQGSYELPTWSPDEEQVLFTLSKGGYGNDYSNLYFMDVKTGNISAITNERNKRIQSSNGELFRENELIYTEIVLGKSLLKSLQLRHDEYEDNNMYNQLMICSNPAVSPDGQWVIFDAPSEVLLRDGTPIQQIYKMNLVTGEILQLTTGEDHKRRPKWAPDGYIVLYEQYDGQFREWSIYVSDYNGIRHRRITESIGDETYGSFSPDSNWIVYSSNRSLDGIEIEKNKLFIKNIYNKNEFALTTSDYYDTAPDWSALSNKIVFQTSPKEPVSYNGSWIAVIEVPEELLDKE